VLSGAHAGSCSGHDAQRCHHLTLTRQVDDESAAGIRVSYDSLL